MARDLKRININMPVDLVSRVDFYADKMGIDRTSAINVLCSTCLDSQKAVMDLSELMDVLRNEQDQGLLDSENDKNKGDK